MKKILLSLFLMVFFAVPAFPQMMDKHTNEGHHGQMMGRCNMDRMGNMMDMCLGNADKIGLTDEQINKITPIHREMQKKQARFKADLKIAEIELMEIMEVKDFDLDKASSAFKNIEGIKTAHHLEMLKLMKEMRAILTDEQFKKMKKMMPTKMNKKKPASGMMKKK